MLLSSVVPIIFASRRHIVPQNINNVLAAVLNLAAWVIHFLKTWQIIDC
jgi:preprotein translocase subunit SecY